MSYSRLMIIRFSMMVMYYFGVFLELILIGVWLVVELEDCGMFEFWVIFDFGIVKFLIFF